MKVMVFVDRLADGTLKSTTRERMDDAVTVVFADYTAKVGSIGPLEFWSIELTPRSVGNQFLFSWKFPADEHNAALAAAAEGAGRDITQYLELSSEVIVPPEAMAIGQTITMKRMPWIYDALVFARWPLNVVYHSMWVCIIVIGWRSGRLEKGPGCRHCGHGERREKGLKCTECGCDTAVV